MGSRGRMVNATARYDLTEDAISKLDHTDVLARLEREDVPCALINHPREMVTKDPQVIHNDLLFETRHPDAGRVLQPRGAARFASAPYVLRHHAPRLGEHSRATL